MAIEQATYQNINIDSGSGIKAAGIDNSENASGEVASEKTWHRRHRKGDIVNQIANIISIIIDICNGRRKVAGMTSKKKMKYRDIKKIARNSDACAKKKAWRGEDRRKSVKASA